jgi:hypothetical protein
MRDRTGGARLSPIAPAAANARQNERKVRRVSVDFLSVFKGKNRGIKVA